MPPAPKALAKKRDRPPASPLAKPVANGEAVPALVSAARRERSSMDDYVLPAREVVRPDNQKTLTEKQLDEELARTLTAGNPAAPSNIVRFSVRERAWRVEASVEQLAVHYTCDGWLLHTSSEDAQRQLAANKAAAEAAEVAARPAPVPLGKAERAMEQRRATLLGPAAAGAPAADDRRQLRNQFNFNERAAQTLVFPPVERGTATEPPPSAAASGACSQGEIYDEYLADQERMRVAEEATRARAAAAKKGASGTADGRPDSSGASAGSSSGVGGLGGGAAAGGGLLSGIPGPSGDATVGPLETASAPAMAQSLRILERMGALNSQHDIVMDYKYWEDAADALREASGTLLPLWKFADARARRLAVTAIAWAPGHPDLFAAAYGSFDANAQGGGAVAAYSLKNPGHPEFFHTAESGVMCLDWSPGQPSLLAVGLYGGGVAVLDVRAAPGAAPLYEATAAGGKHSDPVWSVRWAPAAGGTPAFYSVAGDGRVVLWTLAKAGLQHQEIIELTENMGVAASAGNEADDLEHPPLAAGTCFDFHQKQDDLFVVGTEEGFLHKCSAAFNAEYVSTYAGHEGAVYAVMWNRRHERVFLSASADWTVKLWHDARPKAVMTFDLGCPAGDAAWAPHSATIFAAAGEDGKVRVWDLARDAHAPMCEQRVAARAALTRLAFSPMRPVLLIGDERGCVTSFKLSPNLRKAALPAGGLSAADADVARLDSVMEVAIKSDVGPDVGATA